MITHNIKTAVDLYNSGNYMSALHIATCAVDGCAKKFCGKGRSSFIKFIREYYWLIERFGSLTPNEIKKIIEVDLKNDKGKSIKNLDLADIIYYIFRCYTAHCDEIPLEFKPFDGNAIIKSDKTIHLPTKIVYGLLAACVFNRLSVDLTCDDDYWLSYDSSVVVDSFFRKINGIPYIISVIKKDKITNFPLKDWLGKEDEIKEFLEKQPKNIDNQIEYQLEENDVLYFAELYV